LQTYIPNLDLRLLINPVQYAAGSVLFIFGINMFLDSNGQGLPKPWIWWY